MTTVGLADARRIQSGILIGMTPKLAVGLVAVAGRRRATLDLGQRLEQERFGGIYCSSPGDGLALCQALAVTTREIPLGTSIAKPLEDVRRFVTEVSGAAARSAPCRRSCWRRCAGGWWH